MKWRLALAQTRPAKADLESNLDGIAEAVRQAASEQADLVVFPESAATGYYLEDAVGSHAIRAGELLQGLAERTTDLQRPVDVLVGFYEESDGQPFNSAAYMELGPEPKTVHVYQKFFLPTYAMFDEERHHRAGTKLGVFDSRLGRMGVLICEDVWHSTLGAMLAMSGAQFVLVPTASPTRGLADERPGNVLRYERMLRALSEEHGVYTAAAMLTGFEGGKGLSGGSVCFDPFGEKVVQADLFEPSLVLAEMDPETILEARRATPLLDDLRTNWPRLTAAFGGGLGSNSGAG